MGVDQIYSSSLSVYWIGMKAHTRVCVWGGVQGPHKSKKRASLCILLGVGFIFSSDPQRAQRLQKVKTYYNSLSCHPLQEVL